MTQDDGNHAWPRSRWRRPWRRRIRSGRSSARRSKRKLQVERARERRSKSRFTTGAPYSGEAVTETTQMLADGNRIARKSVTRIYRDSEGRTRRETI